MLVPLMGGEAGAVGSAQIVSPVYTSAVYYSGQGVTSVLKVKNDGTKRGTFWIRYSVQDKAGGVYNVPATSVTLDPGVTSAAISKTWTVPNPTDPSTLTTGFYRASFSVYDANPDTNPGAVRLDYDEKADAFRAHNLIDQFTTFNTNRWTDVWNPQYMGFLGYDAVGNPLYTTYLRPGRHARRSGSDRIIPHHPRLHQLPAQNGHPGRLPGGAGRGGAVLLDLL
jgi:hypothetical protein